MRKPARVRHPAAVIGLTLITLNIYGAFWWYFINRELKDLGTARGTTQLGTEPALSVLAYTVGGIVYVPFIWTIVTTTRRIQAAQRLTGVKPLNGWIAAALWIFTFTIGGIVYSQIELNKVWRSAGMIPVVDGQQRAPLTPPPVVDQRTEQFAKLEQLRAAGAISDEEFEAERVRWSFD